MSSDDPADEAERFAAALDCPGSLPDDPGSAREVALARRLGALAPSLNPDPQARERARRRLLDALAREAPAKEG